MKATTQTIRSLKGKRPIVAVTAYDAQMAAYADEAGVDLILVGDSVGNVLLGFESTVPVTIEMMVHHTAAVARAKPNALLVADVPFAEAHFDFLKVLAGCQRLLQGAGAQAVKIEGGAALAPKIRQLVDAGIAVMGHIGLQPQQIHALGGYRRFGKTPSEADALLADALALERAGVFAILGEMIDPAAAEKISAAVKVPVIGIGSGKNVDGQILVSHDLLGLTRGAVPGFAKAFAKAGAETKKGFAAYTAAVRSKKFPAK